MGLTKRAVDALRYDPKGNPVQIVWDEELKGLGARIYPTGAKAFILNYRNKDGLKRRLTIGKYPSVTVEQARRKATSLLGGIADGEDPLGARKAFRSAVTVSELGIEYLSDVDARKRPSTAIEYRRVWNKHVAPALGAQKVANVTTADIGALHRKMHSTPYQANRMLAMLGAFFRFASRQGVRSKHDNPAHDIPFYAETARERFLTPAEVLRLGNALAIAESKGLPPAPSKRRKPKSDATKKHIPKSVETPYPANPYTVAAIRFLLLSGWREGEALTLRWRDIDLEKGGVILPQTKTGRSIRPLGAAACQLIASLGRIEGTEYVFPGKSLDRPLVNLTRTWYAVRYAAGLEDVRLHDLRHSFASAVASGGGSLLMIRSLLGHKDTATTAKYAHLYDDPIRATADATAGLLADWLGMRPAKAVQ